MNRSWLRVVIIVSRAAAIGFGLWLFVHDDESGGAQEAAPARRALHSCPGPTVALGESLERPF